MHTITQGNYNILTESVFSLKKGDESGFESLALQCFALQYENNPVYRQFCDAIKVKSSDVKTTRKIPFLPIEIFKTKKVLTEINVSNKPTVFTSSGTTDTGTSHHHVKDITLYERSFLKGFELFYGNPENYCVLALLPSYLERNGSSLVYMAQKLIELSKQKESGFFLDDKNKLIKIISLLKERKSRGLALDGEQASPQKTLLLGVSYALLDLAEKGITLDENFIVMETGGMKGRREEMIKSELHGVLKEKFSVKQIHSEYGMTELLTQAYSKQDGIFETPPWMKILVRDTNDPFQYLAPAKTGGINVIDLANINSCCFIATQDLGKLHEDKKFELMGRFDNSDIRGCNLLVE